MIYSATLVILKIFTDYQYVMLLLNYLYFNILTIRTICSKFINYYFIICVYFIGY